MAGMMQSLKLKKTAKYLWIAVLSVSLLCGQGVKIHIHQLDHNHTKLQHHTHDSIIDHVHFSKAHLASDLSHSAFHGNILTERDITPDTLLAKYVDLPFLALFVVLFFLFPTIFYQINFRNRDLIAKTRRRYLFSPGLRAPPY